MAFPVPKAWKCLVTDFFSVTRPFERPFLLAPLHSHSPSKVHENTCEWVCKRAHVWVRMCVCELGEPEDNFHCPSSGIISVVIVCGSLLLRQCLLLTCGSPISGAGWFASSEDLPASVFPVLGLQTASHATMSRFFTSGFWGSNSRPCDQTWDLLQGKGFLAWYVFQVKSPWHWKS